VDVGDGTGGCSACHGSNGSPWPTTGAHAAHQSPALTTPIDCASCHPVPQNLHDAGHLDGVVQVKFGGRAEDRGAAPTWDGASCREVACHGARLRDAPLVVPAWNDASGAASACGACHGIPPSQHTASTSCDRSTCHGTEVTRGFGTLAISAAGKTLHVNGVIDTQ
jgi:predicted CxxxxCH...CXXCH cytochrome family protein